MTKVSNVDYFNVIDIGLRLKLQVHRSKAIGQALAEFLWPHLIYNVGSRQINDKIT